MLKIGEFSRLAQVTVKTLHHYEQMGLIKPYWIDRFTGYRYYTLQQLPRLHRVLALKDLGFSLDQIRRMLDRNLTAAQLRELLADKQAELEDHLREEQQRLDRVAIRLQQIETEGSLGSMEVILKRLEPQMAICIRERVAAVEQVAQRSRELYQRLLEWAETYHVAPAAAPWLTLHDNPEYRDRAVTLMVALPLEGYNLGHIPPNALQQVTLERLSGADQAACGVSAAQPADLMRTTTRLYAWVEANRYRVSGAVRELHLDDRGEAGGEMVEVQFPIVGLSSPFRSIGKEETMDIQIVNKPALTVVGLRYQGKNQNQELSQMWSEFNRRACEIKHRDFEAAYGVCSLTPDMPEGEFEYVGGFAVTKVEDVPEGMVVRSLPAMKYAVFKHIGAMETLGQTYQNIYHEWLPQAGLEPLESGLDMEMYTEEFDNFSAKSIMYILVPVK